MTQHPLQNKAFLLLLAIVSVAFGAILWQFHGAIFWGIVLAILFTPAPQNAAAHAPARKFGRPCTLGLCMVMVILPMTLIGVVDTGGHGHFERVKSGQLNFGAYVQQVVAALPAWVTQLLERLNLTTLAELQQSSRPWLFKPANSWLPGGEHRPKHAGVFSSASGSCCTCCFLLRDGRALALRINHATPLDNDHKRKLVSKFTTVIRATVKGNIVWQHLKGALGGLIFWILGIQGRCCGACSWRFCRCCPL